MQDIIEKKKRKRLDSKPKPDKVVKKSDEKWDELMLKPESEAFLTIMLDEVRQERAKGNLIDGDW
ncbi:MAG: hypothetical protein HW421_822 [Ignavibacteria bacterium]|nr:hypothetical protein [Ignavibacteria bacterium]